MRKPHWIAWGVVAAVTVAGALGVVAYRHFDRQAPQQQGSSNTPAGEAPQAPAGPRLALEEALRIAASHVPGEVIQVERDNDDGVEVFEIKVLAANGRILELTLDARDGRVLEIEDD